MKHQISPNDGFEPNDAESGLFRNAMRDVRPLTNPPAKVMTRKAASAPLPAPPTDEFPPQIGKGFKLQAGDIVSFRASGVQERVLRKLRQGSFRPQQTLDLHGLTADRALSALSQLTEHAVTNDHRHLLIVHGKGYRSNQGLPVLKNRVCDWLASCDRVLAFCTARPEDGGTGAVYVLLKANPAIADLAEQGA